MSVTFKRIIPKEEIEKEYKDIILFLEKLHIFDTIFIEDIDGVWRFRKNQLQELFQSYRYGSAYN